MSPVSLRPKPKSACVSRTLPHSTGTSLTPCPRSCPSPTLFLPSAVCTAPSVAQLHSISEFGSLPFLVSGRLSPQLIAGFCSKSTSQEGAPCLIYYDYCCPNPTTPHHTPPSSPASVFSTRISPPDTIHVWLIFVLIDCRYLLEYQLQGYPLWSSSQDAVFPMQEARVRSLVRELRCA